AAEAAATAAAAGGGSAANRAVGEDDDVEFGAEIAGVESRGPDALEGEIVLLEQPAGPAGGHAAAVGVIKADADGLELEGIAAGSFGERRRGYAELFGGAVDQRFRGGGGGDPDGAGAEVLDVVLHPVDVAVGLEQPVDELERVIDLVADEI